MNEGMKTCGKPSRGRYRQGCRCLMCRAANADYEYERAHGMHSERGLVGERETAQARERVVEWQRDGIGLRTIELWTGVHRSSLQTLVLGNHPNANGATKRMSRENYDAIMSAEPRMAKHANVDSARALSALAELRGRGLTYPQISELSGVKLRTVHNMAYRPRKQVSYDTHAKMLAALSGGCRTRRQLEGWQWQEVRADYARGVEASVLAERYGVSADTLRKHMKEAGVVFASQVHVPSGSVRR